MTLQFASLFNPIFTATVWGKKHCFYFADEEMKAQKSHTALE